MNGAITAEQYGKHVYLTINNETRLLDNCNAIKLMDTIYDKPNRDHYSVEEMYKWGLILKKRR